MTVLHMHHSMLAKLRQASDLVFEVEKAYEQLDGTRYDGEHSTIVRQAYEAHALIVEADKRVVRKIKEL